MLLCRNLPLQPLYGRRSHAEMVLSKNPTSRFGPLFSSRTCTNAFVVTTTGILTRELVNNLVEERALDLVRKQNQIISLWLEERITELELLAQSSLLESLDWEEIEPYLQRRIARQTPTTSSFRRLPRRNLPYH